MGSVIANIFANKELKDRILFTFLMFVIFRLGVHIPVPELTLPSLKACSHLETSSASWICSRAARSANSPYLP